VKNFLELRHIERPCRLVIVDVTSNTHPIESTIANEHSTAGKPAKLGCNSRVLRNMVVERFIDFIAINNQSHRDGDDGFCGVVVGGDVVGEVLEEEVVGRFGTAD
jgi:hypothetical protein